MTRPSDIPQWAWDAADLAGWASFLETPDGKKEAIARALVAAKREGMEQAAVISDQVGEAYGMDETGWWECTETVSASIRQAAKEIEQ